MRLFKTFFLAFGAFLGILLDFVIDSFESHVDTEKRIFKIEQQLWQVKEFLSSSSKSSAPHLQAATTEDGVGPGGHAQVGGGREGRVQAEGGHVQAGQGRGGLVQAGQGQGECAQGGLGGHGEGGGGR